MCNKLSDFKSANDKELPFDSLFLVFEVFVHEYDMRKMKIIMHPIIFNKKLIMICSLCEEM